MQEALAGSAKEEEGGVSMTDDGTNKENDGEYSPRGLMMNQMWQNRYLSLVQKRRKLDRS